MRPPRSSHTERISTPGAVARSSTDDSWGPTMQVCSTLHLAWGFVAWHWASWRHSRSTCGVVVWAEAHALIAWALIEGRTNARQIAWAPGGASGSSTPRQSRSSWQRGRQNSAMHAWFASQSRSKLQGPPEGGVQPHDRAAAATMARRVGGTKVSGRWEDQKGRGTKLGCSNLWLGATAGKWTRLYVLSVQTYPRPTMSAGFVFCARSPDII